MISNDWHTAPEIFISFEQLVSLWLTKQMDCYFWKVFLTRWATWYLAWGNMTGHVYVWYHEVWSCSTSVYSDGVKVHILHMYSDVDFLFLSVSSASMTHWPTNVAQLRCTPLLPHSVPFNQPYYPQTLCSILSGPQCRWITVTLIKGQLL